MTPEDLACVLAWRNHADVRKHMLSQHEISVEEHRRWFEQCAKTGSKKLMIFETESGPLGFVSFSAPDGGRVSEWGFYLAPHAPKGSGSKLGEATLQYGFDDLRLHKIVGRTLGTNESSIRFHRRMGFHQEGVLRVQHFDGEQYHDIICFGLLASEWSLGRSD